MADEWGPWIEHDGARPSIPRNSTDIRYQVQTPGITPPREFPTVEDVENWPGFYWRPRDVKVGWFKTERRLVCDDPEYAPIVRYRIRKPPTLSVGMQMLQAIVADPKPLVKTDDRAPVETG
jgi:hypothetical protein